MRMQMPSNWHEIPCTPMSNMRPRAVACTNVARTWHNQQQRPLNEEQFVCAQKESNEQEEWRAESGESKQEEERATRAVIAGKVEIKSSYSRLLGLTEVVAEHNAQVAVRYSTYTHIFVAKQAALLTWEEVPGISESLPQISNELWATIKRVWQRFDIFCVGLHAARLTLRFSLCCMSIRRLAVIRKLENYCIECPSCQPTHVDKSSCCEPR